MSDDLRHIDVLHGVMYEDDQGSVEINSSGTDDDGDTGWKIWKVLVVRDSNYSDDDDQIAQWCAVIAITFVVLLLVICIKLTYDLIVNCRAKKLQQGDSGLLSASMTSLDGTSFIARDGNAPYHRMSIPQEIQTAFGTSEKSHEGSEINQPPASKPNQDQLLVHLEKGGYIQKDWDLGQGEYNIMAK